MGERQGGTEQKGFISEKKKVNLKGSVHQGVKMGEGARKNFKSRDQKRGGRRRRGKRGKRLSRGCSNGGKGSVGEEKELLPNKGLRKKGGDATSPERGPGTNAQKPKS